jgi:hypothetical protein
MSRKRAVSIASAPPSSIGCAVEALVLQRAEEPLDDAVGLRDPDPSPDVGQQRLIASERRLVGLAAKAGAVEFLTDVKRLRVA